MTYFEKIVDVTTGEETMRPFTKEETAELEKRKAEILDEVAIREAEEATRIAERAALLAKLGITEEEARLLLGGN